MRKEIRNSTKQSDGIRNELDTIGKEQLAINNKGIHTCIIMIQVLDEILKLAKVTYFDKCIETYNFLDF